MVRREILPPSDQNHFTQYYCTKVSGLSARPEWEKKGISEEGTSRNRSPVLICDFLSRGQSNNSLEAIEGSPVL